MSTTTNPSSQESGANQEDISSITSAATPNNRAWKMTSGLDETNGPLRVVSDGKIVEGDTGDLVHLDIPDDEAQQYYTEVNPYALSRRLAIPEAKNGATGLDDPRSRKPISRVVKNWLTGSSRPPAEELQWVFGTALKRWPPWDSGRKPGKIMLGNMVETRRHEGGAQVRETMVQVLKKWHDGELKKAFGHDWASKAGENDKFLVQVEDFSAALVDDKAKVDEEEEDGMDEYDAGVLVDPVPEAPKKRGWLW